MIEKAVGKAMERWTPSMPAAMARANPNTTASPRTYGLAEALGLAMNGVTPDQAANWGLAVPMPRDPWDNVGFGPSNPLSVAPLDPSRPDTGRPEPRVTQYPVSWNIPGGGNRLVPWETLRGAADNIDIIRRCIQVRKEQLEGMQWAIGVDDKIVEAVYAARTADGRADIAAELRNQYAAEIDRQTEFWTMPWKGNRQGFEQWCSNVMEEHLVGDAVAIYPRMSYGGQLLDLEIIDGSTIKPLISWRGTMPEPPYPAYQQELYGYPRGEFTAAVKLESDPETGQQREVVAEGLTADQLYYYVKNVRTWTPYGLSAVEQALLSSRLYLKRMGWMLSEYDDGSTPLMWLVPSVADAALVEKMSARQRRVWEQTLNDELTGNTAARHRIKVTPPGFAPIAMPSVDERYRPEYDLFLIKLLAMPFGVTAGGLGFSETQGLGGTGMHESMERTQEGATSKPDTTTISKIINDCLRAYCGAPKELVHRFIDPETEDSAVEDSTANAQRARGTITLNEDRRRLGLAPSPLPEADMLLFQAGATGWTPVEGLVERMEQQQANEQALVDGQMAANDAAAEGEVVEGEDAEKALELAEYRRWRRKRGERSGGRPFMCKSLEPGDFADGVPADVDFETWVYVPDDMTVDDVLSITKGAGNDHWRGQLRDRRGRWMKMGTHGPALPGKQVLEGLKEQATAQRTARAAREAQASASAGRVRDSSSTMGAMTPETKTSAVDAARAELREAEAEHAKTWGKGPDAISRAAARISRAQMALAQAERDAKRTEAPTAQSLPTMPEGELSEAQAKAHLDALERALADRYGDGWEDVEMTEAEGKAYVAATRAVGDARRRAAAVVQAEIAARPAPRTAEQNVQHVKEAFERTVAERRGGDVTTLAALRQRMGGTRAEQDAALTDFALSRQGTLWPEENQKVITDADREAALNIGGEAKHLIQVDREHRVKPAAGVPRTGERSDEGQRMAAQDRRDRAAEGVSDEQAAANRRRSGRRDAQPAAPSALASDDDIVRHIETHSDNASRIAPLTRVRAAMGGTREEQDAALKRLDRARVIQLDPDPDRDAVKDLVSGLAEVRGDRWNSLSDVRAELDRTGMSRDRQDAALRDLIRNPEHGVRLIPAADQGKRTQAERDASLRVGASDYALIKIMNDDERRSAGLATPEEPKPQPRVAARGITIPDSITGKQRERLEDVGRKLDERHAALFADHEARGAARLADARLFASENPDGVLGQRAKDMVAREEAVARAPRGDAAVAATKAARELVAEADKRGFAVMVSHQEDSGGSPFFEVQVLDPARSQGVKMTWHTRKTKGDTYAAFGGSDSRGRPTTAKAVKEWMDAPQREAAAAALVQSRPPLATSPAQKLSTPDIQPGDYRWNEGLKSWEQIGMISDQPDAVGGRTIYGMDRETRLGALPRDSKTWVVRGEQPTAPPPPEALKALQRKDGEPAKRGDLYVVERTDTTYYGGNSGPSNPRKTYEVHEVTSVTKDGKPAKLRKLGADYEVKLDQFGRLGRGYGRVSILPGDAIDKENLAADLKTHTYSNSTTPRDYENMGELSSVLFGRIKPETWQR